MLDNNDFPLEELGIEGRIIFTPGHSPGSVSVVLNSGEAFAGCMAQNGFPFTSKPTFPIYAFDIEQLKKSWKKLLQIGVKTIYPGHGDPFPVELITESL